MTLQGSRQDTKRLADALPNHVAFDPAEPNQLVLELADPEGDASGKSASRAAKDAIDAAVDNINGLGRLRWGRAYEKVAVVSTVRIDPAGHRTIVGFAGTAHAHLLPEEYVQMLRNMGHTAPPIPEGWEEIKAPDLEAVAKLAADSDDVARILQLVDTVHEDREFLDWRLAYVAIELVDDDLRHRGLEGQALGIWSDRQLALFKRTANSHRALGLRARHGPSSHDPPDPPMTDKQAAWFLRRVVTRWIKHQLGEPLA